MTTRRNFLAAAATAAGSIGLGMRTVAAAAVPDATPMATTSGAAGLELSVQPGRVFKRSSDRNALRTDNWLFNLVLLSASDDKPTLDSLVVRCLSGGEVRRTTTWPAAVVGSANLLAAAPMQAREGGWMVAAFRIADAVPADLAVDRVDCELHGRTAGGAQHFTKTVPLHAYAQKTRLVFPFEGRGMISQGGAWNDGHRNRSGMFAVDAIGLADLYAAMRAQGDESSSAAGWGRPIIAPAAGTVVVARNDRPDQPVLGVSDPKFFVAEFPNGGDPGNHVVIDHGNGEFSLLCHMQHGSVKVAQGQRVEQGQEIGLLGSSGDSSSPHVHHQLQDGPQWTSADALPHVYANGPKGQHDRGVFFNAVR
jgi:hypothetical protein